MGSTSQPGVGKGSPHPHADDAPQEGSQNDEGYEHDSVLRVTTSPRVQYGTPAARPPVSGCTEVSLSVFQPEDWSRRDNSERILYPGWTGNASLSWASVFRDAFPSRSCVRSIADLLPV